MYVCMFSIGMYVLCIEYIDICFLCLYFCDASDSLEWMGCH